MSKQIVLITTGQPSSNPRIVKEAISLSEIGYEVTVIYNFWVSWALNYDKKIIEENPKIHWFEVGGNPINKKYSYYYTRIRHKIYKEIYRFNPGLLSSALRSEARCYKELLKKAISLKADLYVAHNLAALGVAANAAKATGSKFGFDAEDFHRGQVSINSLEYFRIKLMEDKFIPDAIYITAASPLISEQYEILYHKKAYLINNVFSIKYLSNQTKEVKLPISLFWFSQTVGKERGLEDIILALRKFTAKDYTLTILGKSDYQIRDYLNTLLESEIENKVRISFIDPLDPEKIFKLAAQHDIGLAIEVPEEFNRQICLTNKIFTYLLAGNAILFSETSAQNEFLKKNPQIGSIYKSKDISKLVSILKYYLDDLNKLNYKKNASLNLAKEVYNWENEQESYRSIINKVLVSNYIQ